MHCSIAEGQKEKVYAGKPVRIAVVTFGLHIGGHERSMLAMRHCLTQKGAFVELMTTEERGEWFNFFKETGVSVEHIHFHPLGALPHIFRVGRRLKKGKYDVIVLFHAKYAQAAIGMLADNVVVIPTIRLDDDVFYKVGTANAFAWNVLLGNSNKICSKAKELVPERPVMCVPNGIELPKYANFLSRRPMGNKIYLAFLGRLVEHKGVCYLPGILKRCAERGIDCHLTIIGDGTERKSLYAGFENLGLIKNVTFCGATDANKIYGKLLDSHILLFPSLFEGFPNALLEAQACGCVPVASRLNGITDMAIDNGKTGFLIDIGDIEGFADAVSELVKNEFIWSKMSLAGYSWIYQNFSLDILTEAYGKLIMNALDGKYPLPVSRRPFKIDLSLFTWREFIPPFIKNILRPLFFWRKL